MNQETEDLVMWYNSQRGLITNLKTRMPPRIRQELIKLCTLEGISVSEVVSPTMRREVYLVRQKIMKQLKTEGFTCKQIGRLFNRSHSAVVNAVNEKSFQKKFK